MSDETANNEATEEVAVDGVAETPPAKDACLDCQQYIDGWKRANADYANLKRDMERREQEWAKYAAQEIVLKLLPVIESWHKAETVRPSADASGNVDAGACVKWMDGLGHVRNQLESVLSKAGVTVIDEVGVPFDPTRHDALMRQPAPEGTAPDTVLRILELGAVLNEKVIKPAKVIVSE